MMNLNMELWAAAAEGNCATVRRLVISGADLSAMDEQGRNAFQIASQNGQSDVMTTILAAKQMIELEKMGITGAEALKAMDKSTDELIAQRTA